MRDSGYIFIAHSHKDIAQVRKIRDMFEDAGIEPILFYLRSMDGSASEDRELLEGLIHREIDSRELFLYVDSENARRSPWVQEELAYVRETKGDGLASVSLSQHESQLAEAIRRIIRSQTVCLLTSGDTQAACAAVGGQLRKNGFLVSQLSLESLASGKPQAPLEEALGGARVLAFVSQGTLCCRAQADFVLGLVRNSGLDVAVALVEDGEEGALEADGPNKDGGPREPDNPSSNDTRTNAVAAQTLEAAAAFGTECFFLLREPTKEQLAALANSFKARFSQASWGPSRQGYHWDKLPQFAAFNSIVDNPAFGDERRFVRIREKGIGEFSTAARTLEPGKAYEVSIYYHNDADPATVGKKAIGIADGAAVKSSFPSRMEAGKPYRIDATIFASDCEPLAVWSSVQVTARADCLLEYVPGTAVIRNGGGLNGTSIGPRYLFGQGALLGYGKISGILPGGAEYAGYVTYELKVRDAREGFQSC